MENKIAFLCLAHNNFTYLEHLSNYYCSDGDGFILHVDSNVNIENFSGLHKDTVILQEKERFRTRWGTLNIVLATLMLLEKAFATKKYNRYILVSGSDTPLKTKEELKYFLSPELSYFSIWGETQLNEKSTLGGEFFKRHFYYSSLTNPGEAYLTKQKSKIYLMLILNKFISFIPFNKKFKYKHYYKGSQWWSMTNELVEHVLLQANRTEFFHQFKFMHAPDEKFFQTIALNSPFKNLIEVNLGKERLKQGLHYVDWGVQKIKPRLQSFTPDDIDKAKLLDCCFARKVENVNIEYFIDYVKQLSAV
jgi:hypothetical protein